MPSFMIIMFHAVIWHQGLAPEVTILAPKTMKQCETMVSSFNTAAEFQKTYNSAGPTLTIGYRAWCEKIVSRSGKPI